MISAIKIVLAVLLFICLADMPYGYFQFVRFVAVVAFGLLAHQANEDNQKSQIIIYVVLAILFQPFLKISLGRELWNIVDVLVGAGLLLSLAFKSKANEK